MIFFFFKFFRWSLKLAKEVEDKKNGLMDFVNNPEKGRWLMVIILARNFLYFNEGVKKMFI